MIGPMRIRSRLAALAAPLALACVATALGAAPAEADTTDPLAPLGGLLAPVTGVVSDVQAMADGYGRITGPNGQLQNPNYLPALLEQASTTYLSQLTAMAATPTRPSLTGATLVPGFNVGNPLRAGWNGTRGVATPVAFTNRYGALLRGTVYSPRPGARDPYTGAPLEGPFPGVVVTPGSVQGSSGMYQWLGQDLAERGYVVLVYDVQGQGLSETLPHDTGSDLPLCFPVPATKPLELTGCAGVPFQQPSNFVYGTLDATDFFFSTPQAPYANPLRGTAPVDSFNPLWASFDRTPLPRATAPGRTTRFAIVGHSLGAFAVSYVQGVDPRVSTVVALDKLDSGGSGATNAVAPVPASTPRVPALGVQAEYGFTVAPSILGANSLTPGLSLADDPQRELKPGYGRWTGAGLDTMIVVPRSSTHLDFTDIPLVLPASRYGQALTSVYTQAWLDHWLKGAPVAPLLAPRFTYLEPTGKGVWSPITLDRAGLLSRRFCSAYRLTEGGTTSRQDDVNGVTAGAGC